MAFSISAPADAMRQSAAAMTDAKSDIEAIVLRVMGEVRDIQFKAGSSTEFQNAMEDWRSKTAPIINDLDDMAKRLNASASRVDETEGTNMGTANFMP